MEELEQRLNNLEQINNSLQEEIIRLYQELNKPVVEVSNYATVKLSDVLTNADLGDTPEERIETFLNYASTYKILFM